MTKSKLRGCHFLHWCEPELSVSRLNASLPVGGGALILLIGKKIHMNIKQTISPTKLYENFNEILGYDSKGATHLGWLDIPEADFIDFLDKLSKEDYAK